MNKKSPAPRNNYDESAPNFEYDHLGAYHHDMMAQNHPDHHEEGYMTCPTCVQERTAADMDQAHGKRNLSLRQFAGMLKKK